MNDSKDNIKPEENQEIKYGGNFEEIYNKFINKATPKYIRQDAAGYIKELLYQMCLNFKIR